MALASVAPLRPGQLYTYARAQGGAQRNAQSATQRMKRTAAHRERAFAQTAKRARDCASIKTVRLSRDGTAAHAHYHMIDLRAAPNERVSKAGRNWQGGGGERAGRHTVEPTRIWRAASCWRGGRDGRSRSISPGTAALALQNRASHSRTGTLNAGRCRARGAGPGSDRQTLAEIQACAEEPTGVPSQTDRGSAQPKRAAERTSGLWTGV